MESKNYKIVKNFLKNDERKLVIDWINSLKINQSITNHHIKEVRKSLNGNSYMFDISKTSETKHITTYQSSNNVINQDTPQIIENLIDRISDNIKIPKNRVFLQAIQMESGGKVSPHYDSSLPGFINYKCNISVLSDNYKFYIDKDIVNVNESDLYCFEASLYKHWSDTFTSKRILLSFGFVLSYKELQRDINDPRVRLSERIQKYFQK